VNILLAWDASKSSECFLRRVAKDVWLPGTSFTVLTVVEPLDRAPGLEGQLLDRASRQADGCAAGLRAQGLDAIGIARQGDPSDVIVREATEMGAGLVIVGAPAAGRSTHLLGGSVARRVLRFAHCSVRICRPGPEADTGGFRVLVPVDGSDYSKMAVVSLTARAWPGQTVFEVLSVVEPVSASVRYLYPGYTESAEAARIRATAMQHAQEAIRTAEQTLTAAGLKVMDTVMVPMAAPEQLIIEEAARWQADLIVMGSHGRRGVSRFLLGSVSEPVALHAACSVEVIRHSS